MANFNTLIKRKQYLWLGLILVAARLPLVAASICQS
jgi:hypothetical protein